MSVERTGFEILMSADASGVVKGSKEGAEALGTVAGKTKDLNDALDAGKPKLEDHGKNLEEGSHHAKLFGDRHHEAHAAVKSLGELFPWMTGLAREMFNVWTLGIGLVGMAVGAMVEAWKNAGEAEKKFAEEAGKGTGTMLDAQATAAHEAAVKHEELATALNKAAGAESSFMRSIENRIKAFKDYIEAMEKVGKAEDDVEEKRIQREVRDKKISEEEGQARIGAIHGHADTRSAMDKEAAAVFEMEAHKLELARAEKTKADAEQAKADAEARENQAKPLAEANKGNADESRKRLYGTADRKGYEEGSTPENPAGNFPESLQGKLNEAIKKYEEALEFQSHPFRGVSDTDAAQVVAKAKEEMDDAMRRVQKTEGEVKTEEALQLKREAELHAAQMEKAAAEKRAAEAQKTIDKLGGPEGNIAQEAKKLDLTKWTDAQLQAIRDKAAAQAQADANSHQDEKEANAASAVATAKSYIEQSSRDIPGSAGAKADIKILTETIHDLTDLLSEFTKNHWEDAQGLGAEIADLKRRVALLSMTVNHNRSL